MRPLPQEREANREMRKELSARGATALTCVLLAVGAWTLGCGGGGAGSVAPPPPPPPSIMIGVAPQAGTVLLGETLNFSATVSNTSDTAVVWSVNGIAGGSSQVGTISADGVYMAPTDLPSGGTVRVTATSHADASKSAVAAVTVASDISISLSSIAANVELGAQQTFQATVSSSGKPDTTVHWSLTGSACPTSCGTVDGNGNYTAPQVLPSSSAVNLVATSAADPSRQALATISITSHFTLQLSAPSNVQAGGTSQLTATLTPVSGSNPNPSLIWTLQGTGCTGSECGILTVTTTQSAGTSPVATSAVYVAPQTPPQPNTVLVTVTPQADPSKRVQAAITIQAGGGSISVSPASVTVAANHRVTFSASLGGTASGTLDWSVNGIAGGSSTVGQICVAGSNPCSANTGGSAGQVDYVAPGSIPAVNPVTLTVSSATEPNLAASARITVINHVVVSVLPNSVTVAPLGVQSFSASVVGAGNQNVTWQITGTGCTQYGSCGVITSSGIYTAPAVPPTPDALQVVAVSQDDQSQSGNASVVISNAPNILFLHPASVYAGGTNGFTLRADGSGFVTSGSGNGSTLLVGGSTRITSCASGNSCSAPLTAADAAQAGSLSVSVRNPDGTVSNVVSLVMALPNNADDVITLTSAAPAATGKDIVVVEPTTAGVDSSADELDLDVAAVGTFVVSSNTCNLAGNPIPLTRPASGTGVADICLFSQVGFDTSMVYTISGPGDVSVISKQPAGLGIIHLTLQIPATASPGERTLFIQNANLDRTAASGVLQIE